jgi:myo-inositol-1-phosphate synthase
MTPLKSASGQGELGLFVVGMGAVATTLFAGVELIRRCGRPAIGSFTQLGWMPDGRGGEGRAAELLPLTPLDGLEFGGVDLIEPDAGTSAANAGVLRPADLEATLGFLDGITAGPGIHDPTYVRTLPAVRVRPEKGKAAQAAAMAAVYRDFLSRRGCARGVVLLTLSTETWRPVGPVHATPESFRMGLEQDAPDISPSQIYAWAAVEAGCPVVNCTPNPVLEVPALAAFAQERGVPLCGSDLKSGQTLMKTVVAGGLARRLLGVRGWFSTNILGNRDGFVLHEPENFRTKEITKTGVLADLLDAQRYPELYGGLEHQVHINYFPPKGDNKEAWDSIQLAGWLGYEMELKIDFQCRDSILAAPLVLDLALLSDLAARRGRGGVQSWLGLYFKHPAILPGETRTNDLPRQFDVLQQTLAGWVKSV